MRPSTTQDVLQVILVLACGSALAAAGRALHPTGHPPGSWQLEQLLGGCLTVLGLGTIAAWLATFAIALVPAVLQRVGRPSAAHTANRLAARCTPAIMRRLAAAVVGVNLLAVPVVAHAAPAAPVVVSQQFHPRTEAAERGVSIMVITDAAGSAVDRGAVEILSAGSRTSEAGTANTRDAAGVVTSPYWSFGGLTGSGTVSVPEPDPGNQSPSSQAVPAPVTPGWKPLPIPVDGGLLLRQETRSTTSPTDVVVAPGDSLWSIVAAHLGPLAGSAEVADAWPAWFEANRTIIGNDPSLLIPGQVLRAPRH